MRPPTLVIEVPLEGAPRIRLDVLDECEEARLRDWLRSSLVLARVAHDAIELLNELLDEEENDPEAAA
jgi:hypothetical protein